MINNIKFNNYSFNELNIIATNSNVLNNEEGEIVINCNLHTTKNVKLFISELQFKIKQATKIYINDNNYFYYIKNVFISDFSNTDDPSTFNFNLNVITDNNYYTEEGGQWTEPEDTTEVPNTYIYKVQNKTYNNSFISFKINTIEPIEEIKIYKRDVLNKPFIIKNVYNSKEIIVDGLLKEIYSINDGIKYLITGFSEGEFITLDPLVTTNIYIKVDNKENVENILIKLNNYI